jgi:hypothetical protein
LDSDSPWKSVPFRNILIFLAAVFFVFAAIGFVSDSIDGGRENTLHYVLSVLLSGLFAVAYAAAGITLKRKFWIPFIPLFLLHIGGMTLLAKWLPDKPKAVQYDAAATAWLNKRLTFDGMAVIVCISLGYAGFVTVSVSEGRRYGRLQGEKALLDSEMAAAREIQRLMVPEELPATPGYQLECVYRPAAQVGGDFFQVIPLKSGHTLVIVGDVSGKGLTSAMIVSMLVGMLCTVTGFTEDPAEILGELNRRLCGRTHGGFVTCEAIRLEADGRVTLANAGHLPPYRNGMEVSFAGSLPLGLSTDVVYEQSAFVMQDGDRLFLLTDGIVEAQNQAGELLGFPRVESMLREGATAHALAEAAQELGQADDITAIRIERASGTVAGVGRSAAGAYPVAS